MERPARSLRVRVSGKGWVKEGWQMPDFTGVPRIAFDEGFTDYRHSSWTVEFLDDKETINRIYNGTEIKE